MDKVLSARLNESSMSRLENLARELHATKKSILEEAIKMFAARVETESKCDVLEQTSGAWKRSESSRETVNKARKAFSESMSRHGR